MNKLLIICICCFVVVHVTSDVLADSGDEIYHKELRYYDGFERYWNPGRVPGLQRVSYDRPLISSFPGEEVESLPLMISYEKANNPVWSDFIEIEHESQNYNMRMIYYVHSSIEDAEDHILSKMIEVPHSFHLDTTSGYGDNVWVAHDSSYVFFIEHNVTVLLYFYSEARLNAAHELARRIDGLLLDSDKTYDTSIFPTIHSIEMNRVADEKLRVAINATDPLGKNMYYDCFGNAHSFTDANPILVTIKPEMYGFKFFVMTDDRRISSYVHF